MSEPNFMQARLVLDCPFVANGIQWCHAHYTVPDPGATPSHSQAKPTVAPHPLPHATRGYIRGFTWGHGSVIDQSTPASKTRRISILEGLNLVGTCVGQAAGGKIAEKYHFRVVFLVVMGM